MREIRFAPEQKEFTFLEDLNGEATISIRPQKFSPTDKYAKYRRQALEKERKESGLIKD